MQILAVHPPAYGARLLLEPAVLDLAPAALGPLPPEFLTELTTHLQQRI